MTNQDSEERGLVGGGSRRTLLGHAGSTSAAFAALVAGTFVVGAVGGWLLSPRGEPDVPIMATLSQDDVAQALTTLNTQAQQTARLDSRECRFPMGFITVATPGNPAGGTVVFRTSKYQSPPFHVTIAIPNPLPESGGIDLLSADGNAKGLLVSLHPTAHMEPVNGSTTIKVFWRPRRPCR
jgi:hypothetical protein